MTLKRLIIPSLTAAAVLSLSGCQTPKREVQPPSLSYKAAAQCTSAVSFDQPMRRTSDEKKRAAELRKRSIYFSQEMANRYVPCFTGPDGQDIPYTVFEIPTDIQRAVVNAGSKYDRAVIFAGRITTHDENGAVIRDFADNEYRRLGSIYGVQFSPRESERYVLIKADADLVGNREETVETDTQRRHLQTYDWHHRNRGYDRYGLYSSRRYNRRNGTNTEAVQENFIRTYSFNGAIAVQTVFPKQK